LIDFSGKLQKDLKKHAENYDYEKILSLNETITCEMKFTAYYPKDPPVIRLLKPRLEYGTGNVSVSGLFETNEVLREGWSNFIDIPDLCENIRNNLIKGITKIIK
jgi:ubiquitin-conjugating enzyme E2 Q